MENRKRSGSSVEMEKSTSSPSVKIEKSTFRPKDFHVEQ